MKLKKSEKSQNLKMSPKSRIAVLLFMAILSMGLMTACGSDEIEEYQNDTVNNMQNATDYVDDARDVVDDLNSNRQNLNEME